MVALAQNSLVYPGEMSEIHEVFDRAGGAASPKFPLPEEESVVRVFVQREFRDGRARFAREANPNDAVSLLSGIGGQAGLLGDGVLRGNRGDSGAFAFGVIRPAVVGADKMLALHPSQGKGRAAVDAKVAERANLPVDPTHDDAFIQELDGQRLLRRLLGPADRMLVFVQRGPELGLIHRDFFWMIGVSS